jgi:hypothetical protein
VFQKQNNHLEVTICGVVVPDGWDTKSNVTSIVISTTFEEEYRVMDNEQGRQLMQHLKQEVRASGKVFNNGKNGDKSILIKEFSVVGTT